MKDDKIFFTFYSQCKESDVAKYFCEVLLESNQSQRNILDSMVRFARDNGFKMEPRGEDYLKRAHETRVRKTKKIMTIKKRASKK